MLPSIGKRGFGIMQAAWYGNPLHLQNIPLNVAKDTAFSVGKEAAITAAKTMLPGGALIGMATEAMVHGGVDEYRYGNGEYGRTLAKAGLNVAMTGAVSPLGPLAPFAAIPLSMATGFAVDKTADLYDTGIHNAYNNFCRDSEYREHQMIADLTPNLKQSRFVDEEDQDLLKMSFCKFSH